MTTTTDTAPAPAPASCTVCRRTDVKVSTGRKGMPDVLATHVLATHTTPGDTECLGSALPVLPADKSDDTPVDAIRRYAIGQFVKATKAARENRENLAHALLSNQFTMAGALDYYELSGIRHEQAADLWLTTAYGADWARSLADALQILGARAHRSTNPVSNEIDEQKREGARTWLRGARHHFTVAYADSGITGAQMAALLFNL